MGGFGPSTSRRGISEGPELSVSRPDGFSDGQPKGLRRFDSSSQTGQTSNPPQAAFVGANHLFAGLALHQIRPRARSAAAPRQRVSYSRSLNPGPTSVPVCDAGPIFTLESERSLTIAQAGMLEPTPGVDRNTARRAGGASPRSPRRREEGLMTTTKIQSIFSTMYGTGARVSEAVHLRAADIDSQRMMIRIEQGKGRKDRYVQLSPKLLELLRSYWRKVRPRDWLFPGPPSSEPLIRDAVRQAVAHASQRAGLKKRPSPHSLRHAYAVPLLSAGTYLRKIQLLLGHRSLSTTARYLRLATSTVCPTTTPLDLLPYPVVDPQP